MSELNNVLDMTLDPSDEVDHDDDPAVRLVNGIDVA